MTDLIRSKALNNIPIRKLQDKLSNIEQSESDQKIKLLKSSAYNRFTESNIPIEYWDLKMEKNFQGDQRLLVKYNDYTENLKNSYIQGKSFCLAGGYGKGKTLTLTCVLKKACLKGYTCLYTSLEQIVSVILGASSEDKFLSKRELSLVDFLVIDEVDIRFFNQSDVSNELFGRTFESVLRTRLSNQLPILLATNSPNIKQVFTSFFKESLGSLMEKVEIFPVFGEDFRKTQGAS